MNWLQMISKLMALINAIQADPALLAAIQDLIALLPKPAPAPTGGGATMLSEQHHMNLEKQHPNEMAKLKTAFNKNADVHEILSEGTHGAKTATDIGGLFSIFTQLLPLIIQIIGTFKKPATT